MSDKCFVLDGVKMTCEQVISTVTKARDGSTFTRRVKGLVRDQLGLPYSKELNMGSHFVNDLGVDSLDLVQLLMAAEEEFDTEIPDDKAEKIQTIGDAVRYFNPLYR